MKCCQMSLAADVTYWRCLIAFIGIMLVVSHSLETKFVFLKEVSPVVLGKVLKLLTLI